MAGRGHYRMQRGWMDNAAFQDEPLCERAAWVWLVEQAAFRPHQREINGVTVDVHRGDIACTYRFLARAWRWSGTSKVHRFLARLQRCGMVNLATEGPKGRSVTRVTVVNYDGYQAAAIDDEPGTVAGTGCGTVSGTPEPAENCASQPDPGTVAGTGCGTGAGTKEKEWREKEWREKEGDSDESQGNSTSPSRREIADGMRQIYAHELGDILPSPKKLNDARVKAAYARFIGECERDYEPFRAACQRVRKSQFLRGEAGRPGWKGATFDWLIKPTNYVKVIEGNYDDGTGTGQGAGGQRQENRPARPANPLREAARQRAEQGCDVSGGGERGSSAERGSADSAPERLRRVGVG